MKFIGLLMIEHRLIERVVVLLRKEIDELGKGREYNPDFVYEMVDFFMTYADRMHHGKEEDILFKELTKRNISEEHKQIMNELIEEHVIARKNVGGLLEANEKYVNGEYKETDRIMNFLKALAELYPYHINKEDSQFFIPVLNYFNEEELQSILEQFYDFDGQMIHEKYTKMLEKYE
jgi:hemerythrin-like domain-containing protein